MARLFNELLRHLPDRAGRVSRRCYLERTAGGFGAGSIVGRGCILLSHTHRSDEIGVAIQHQGMYSAPVRIGARAWLGMRVLVLPGVEVGEDAIVASGAVVTSSIPARTIAAGVPARVVRER